MSNNTKVKENVSPMNKVTLLALSFASFASQPALIITGLLLIDIGNTFGSSVGVTGQIRTLSPFIAFVTAVLLGALSLRFRAKDLLMMGLVLLGLSALLCGFAPDFFTLLLFYSLSGLGGAMITPMALTLAGTYFPLKSRAGAISWIVSAQALAYLVGTPIISFLAGIGGWRWAFFWFALPVSLIGFFLAFAWLPKEGDKNKGAFSLRLVFAGFKGVFSNTSATACLLGNVFSLASTTAVLLYAASFQRQIFGVSLSVASLITLGSAVFYTGGSFLAGRLVRSYGMKQVTVISAVIAGVLTIFFTEVPILWLSVAVVYIGMFFSGARVASSNSLAIEQVPGLSGMMMSFNLAASYLGQTLGSGLGGLALVSYSYYGMSLVLGILGVFSGLIYHLKVVDPTKAR